MLCWTGEQITQLEPNYVFVFGSNPEGRHGAGAARTALQFGAKYGVGRGLQGQTYALVTKNLNTDFTAQRMIGYLYHYEHPPVEEIADEMISILSDRNRIMEKKELEAVNARWNDFLMRGIEDEEE